MSDFFGWHAHVFVGMFSGPGHAHEDVGMPPNLRPDRVKFDAVNGYHY